ALPRRFLGRPERILSAESQTAPRPPTQAGLIRSGLPWGKTRTTLDSSRYRQVKSTRDITRCQRLHPIKCCLLDPAKAEVFDFHELVDAVVRAFPSQTRLLYPSKRSNLGRYHAGVDANHPALYGFGPPPNPADIAAVEITGKPKFSVIG